MESFKKVLVIPAMTIGLLAFVPVVFAHDDGSAHVEAVAVNATSTAVRAGLEANVGGSKGNQPTSATGTTMSTENRSTLGPALRALLQAQGSTTIDRDVAAEVQATIMAHASTTEQDAEVKAKVEARSGWLTFLIGSDYRNLGKLRSTIATTENHIERLTEARDKATDATVKAEITAEINALQLSASTTEAFVATHENKLSVFGWFFRIFSE